ncbi:hypothetical protein SAMN05216302_100598 [Nitrosomonas aestuarii]|uniref:Uncharacterized protein n=1 Tax=Nitrosomonas aestuarii TaxID=52441 RepID=A0A1I3Z684_9PROT|nr:hypothetical protein SAMN05216302_100598 [Nitrosomonas aestuarii]
MGFGFLGYHFSRAGLSIAIMTIERFVECATRLYEQEQYGSRARQICSNAASPNF